MPDSLRFQILVLPNRAWGPLLERYLHVEELGFDIVGVADHFCDWSNPPSEWLELWTVLAGVAQATSRIRITPMVAQIPLRNPALFARQALTVDHISSGRLEVGLGLGLPIDPTYDMMGIENWTNPERADRFMEYIDIVDRMLSNEEVSYEGRYYSVKNATMRPATPQRPRPPITVAALGPRMIRCAAERADTWNTMSFKAVFEEQLDETAARIETALAHCKAVGRDRDELRISYNMFDADSRASGGRIKYYESEEIFLDMARRVMALGVDELGLYYPMVEEQVPMFERIARDVFPVLRAEAAAAK